MQYKIKHGVHHLLQGMQPNQKAVALWPRVLHRMFPGVVLQIGGPKLPPMPPPVYLSGALIVVIVMAQRKARETAE